MPGEFRIEGLDQFEKLGRDLKAIGNKGLKTEFLRSARELGKPVSEAFKRAELANLPSAGGLNAWTAGRMRTTTQVRLSGPNIGVKFKSRRTGADLKGLEAGLARHPLFGDKNHWYATPVRPNIIAYQLAGMTPVVRAQFLAAVDRMIVKLRAGG